MNKFQAQFGNSWYNELGEFINSSNFIKIGQQVAQLRKQSKQIIPPQGSDLLFKAFRSTPYDKVKVICLGLDPYHTIGAFDGIAFSNSTLSKPQPSLRNILKEVEDDIYNGLNLDRTSDYSLYNWAEQGILLINTALTVEVGKPESHLNIWKPFTEEVIRVLNKKNDLVWMLWGNKAQSYEPLITNPSHYIIKTGHPSPLNTSNPFKGCRCFSECNKQLVALNKSMIIW